MNMMEALEELKEKQEQESRFVAFGYILLEALEKIQTDFKPGIFCDCPEIAKIALDKFKAKVVGGLSDVANGRTSLGLDNKKCYCPQSKVYCDQCRFYKHETLAKESDSVEAFRAVDISLCLYSENIGTWLNAKEPRRHPSELNKSNDCKWFEKKQ